MVVREVAVTLGHCGVYYEDVDRRGYPLRYDPIRADGAAFAIAPAALRSTARERTVFAVAPATYRPAAPTWLRCPPRAFRRERCGTKPIDLAGGQLRLTWRRTPRAGPSASP